MSTLPTLQEISPTKGLNLDEKEAITHFLGVNVDEARGLFFENPLYYSADLMWMGLPAFLYYLPAFAAYLRADASLSDADSLNSLATTLAYRLDNLEGESTELSRDPCVQDTVHYCLCEFERFEVDEKFFPKLKPTLLQIRDALRTKP